MPTIKDIAKLAGVSQGTVSNVLNRRGNVSTQKMRLVEEAMSQLGYTVNAQARQLRNNIQTSHCVAVILPNILDFKYSFLYTGIKWYLEQHNLYAQLYLTGDIPYTEQTVLNEILSQRPAGIISVASCSHLAPLYESIISNGEKIVFVERNYDSDVYFVGYDFARAGKDIAEMVIQKKVGRVGIYTGLSQLSHEAAFRSAFIKALESSSCNIGITAIECDMPTADKNAYKFFDGSEYPDIIVTSGTFLANSVSRASAIVSAEHIPLILTLSFDTKFDFSANQERYCMDYYALGKAAVDKLMVQFTSNGQVSLKDRRTILQPEGIKRFSPIIKRSSPIKLNVMTINGQGAESLRYMAPYYTRKSNVELNIIALPPHEAFDNLLHLNSNVYFDIFRSNLAITPLLNCDDLVSIPTNVYEAITRTMMPRAVAALSYNHGEHYAVPMDVATQMLAYRKDLFEDSLIKRLYYEKNDRTLDIPHTFEEFNSINRFFCREANSQSPVLYGSTSALGTGSAILTNFLLRYRPLKGFIRYQNGHLIMDIEKAIEATEAYYATVKHSIISNNSLWWDDNVNNLVAGSTAMELISVNYSANLVDFRRSQIEGRLGYAQVPGNGHGIGGGSFVISKKCNEPQAAIDFLLWACGQDQAEMFTYLGGTSLHSHVYKKSRILQLYPWYENFENTVESTVDDIDWQYINRYKMENLFGYILRNVFHGILTCSQGMEMIAEQLDSCLLER